MARAKLFLLVLGVAGAGCRAPADPVVAAVRNGSYDYLARLDGSPVVEGTLTLQIAADSSVTGTWALHRFPGSDTNLSVGPQLGTGSIAGHRSATSVWLDLNPGWADNNVFLVLTLDATDLLSGEWHYSTIIGPVSGGSAQLHSSEH